MYVVESLKPPLNNYDKIYHLIGEVEETTIFKRNVGSLALEAVNKLMVTPEDAYNLMSSFNEGALGMAVPFSSKDTLDTLVSDSSYLANNRKRRLFDNAMEEGWSINAIWDEFEALREFEFQGAYDSSGLIHWVNRVGYTCFFDNGEIKPYIDTEFEEAFGAGARETLVARELGLNAFVGQVSLLWPHPLKPEIKSAFEHTTIGQLDDQGGFESVLTVLESRHPIRRIKN